MKFLTDAANMARMRRCQESWDDRLPDWWDSDDDEGFTLATTRTDGSECEVLMYLDYGCPVVDCVVTASCLDFDYSAEESARWIKEALEQS